jgi:2-methylcitrate dehydratase
MAAGMDEPTTAIVEFVRAAKYADLTPGCVHAVTRNYLDTIGCAAAGFAGESSTLARQIASTTGGTPAASAFGLQAKPLVEYAVLANSAAVRYCDWNDGGLSAGHPSDMSSAVTAMAEASGASGQDLITALYVAYETVAAFGKVVPLRDRAWDQGFFISIGTAAGLSNLLGLTDEQIANAVAVAITPAIPLRISRAGELSHWKSMASGYASVTATLATRLAAEGVTGPRRVFDGTEGVFEKVTGEFELGPLGAQPGQQSVPERVQHKYFPSFMESQGPITMMLKLRGQFDPDDVESILLTTFYLAWHEGGGGQGDAAEKWDPKTRETADHSLPYLMARAFFSGLITPDSFSEDLVLDPALRPFMEKIVILEDKEFSARRKSHHEERAVLRIKLKDGREFTDESIFARGHPKNPMTDDELGGKFDASVQKVLSPQLHNELRDRLWALESQEKLDELCALFRQFGRQG